MTRRTKIVATIGPACNDHETLVEMVDAGMDVARLNFSHGTPEQHAETCARVRTAADRAGRPVAVLQDLPGPKLRIGPLRDGLAELAAGDRVTFVGDDGGDTEGDERRMAINWPALASAIGPGEELYLADGAVRLRVEAVRPSTGEVEAVVRVGGTVASRQGLNIPGEVDEFPAVFEDDLNLLHAGEKMGVDIVALSFVQRARGHPALPRAHAHPAHREDREAAGRRAPGVDRRGGRLRHGRPRRPRHRARIEDVPLVQKRIIALAGRRARPVITATQMLDSMVGSSRPTRAEVTDVANAILDGTDAVMLSQETAVGAYPVGAIRMMAADRRAGRVGRALRAVERVAGGPRRARPRLHDRPHRLRRRAQLNLAALVIPTLSGRSARLVSAHRPQVPIYALSPGKETVRRCSLMWGVRGRAHAPPRGHRGAHPRRRAPRGRARLGQAGPAHRRDRRPAQRAPRHDLPVPGDGGVRGFPRGRTSTRQRARRTGPPARPAPWPEARR